MLMMNMKNIMEILILPNKAEKIDCIQGKRAIELC